MSTDTPPILDPLAALASPDIQKLAARMAQDLFAGTFQHSVSGTEADMAEVENRCRNWCQAAADEEARALRLALLISGLDQWGLAYSQAFQLTAIPALSQLIGALRTGLDTRADARFQWFFSQIEQDEKAAIDFKVELRRHIHLALWHAMAACETEAEAGQIGRTLGALLLALQERMPELGWRLVADTLASIQLALLTAEAPSGLAQESTRQLFEALRQALPQERYQSILAHSGQVVLAWQRSRQPG